MTRFLLILVAFALAFGVAFAFAFAFAQDAGAPAAPPPGRPAVVLPRPASAGPDERRPLPRVLVRPRVLPRAPVPARPAPAVPAHARLGSTTLDTSWRPRCLLSATSRAKRLHQLTDSRGCALPRDRSRDRSRSRDDCDMVSPYNDRLERWAAQRSLNRLTRPFCFRR